MNRPMIRRMTEGDAAAVARIQAAAVEAAQWEPRGYLAFEAFVIEVDGRVAGFLAMRETAPGEAEVLNLAIAPEFRRQGLARRILEQAAFRERRAVFLEVRQSNAAGRSLYRSLGFVECGERANYYRDPAEAAVLMRRDPD